MWSWGNRIGNSIHSVIMAFIVLSNKWSEIRGMEWVERLYLWTKWDLMKQWVEPESTKAWNKTFSNRSEDKLTAKDVGLDKEEEIEEALILTSLGMHSKLTQPLECTGAWGLLTNFLPQRPSWGKPSLEGQVFHPYWVCPRCQSSLAAKYWP